MVYKRFISYSGRRTHIESFSLLCSLRGIHQHHRKVAARWADTTARAEIETGTLPPSGGEFFDFRSQMSLQGALGVAAPFLLQRVLLVENRRRLIVFLWGNYRANWAGKRRAGNNRVLRSSRPTGRAAEPLVSRFALVFFCLYFQFSGLSNDRIYTERISGAHSSTDVDAANSAAAQAWCFSW